MNTYHCFIVSTCFMQSLAYPAEFTPRPTILLPKSSQDASKIEASTVAQETALSPHHYFQERVRVNGFYFMEASLFPSLGLAEDVTKTYVANTPACKNVLFCATKPQEKKLSDGQIIPGAKKVFLCAFFGSDGKQHPIPFAAATKSLTEAHYITTPSFVDEDLHPQPLKK